MEQARESESREATGVAHGGWIFSGSTRGRLWAVPGRDSASPDSKSVAVSRREKSPGAPGTDAEPWETDHEQESARSVGEEKGAGR